MDTKKQVKKIIKSYEGWFDLPSSKNLREHAEQQLEKELKSSNPRASEVCALQLHHLAVWYSKFGIDKILRGDNEGWFDLEKAYYYRWYYFRIDQNYLFKVQEPALVLCESIVRRLDTEAAWIAQCQLNDIKSLNSPLWKVCPFALFSLELWAKLQNQPQIKEITHKIQISKEKESVLIMYRSILENWENESKLQGLLVEAGDYHLSQSMTEKGYAEFYFTPYDLFPVEILAINIVRDRMGHNKIKVKHPLMINKIADYTFVSNFLPEKDKFLQQVVNKAKYNGRLTDF